jgi:hypothetical protein
MTSVNRYAAACKYLQLSSAGTGVCVHRYCNTNIVQEKQRNSDTSHSESKGVSEMGSSRGLSAGTTAAFTWRDKNHKNHQSGSRFQSGSENRQLKYDILRFSCPSKDIQGEITDGSSEIVPKSPHPIFSVGLCHRLNAFAENRTFLKLPYPILM